LLVALLLPMWAIAPGRAGVTQGAESQTLLILVLEFNNKLPKPERSTVDRGYLADRVRRSVLRGLPKAHILTRENVTALAQSRGLRLEDCEGLCEVELGRTLDADLVVWSWPFLFGARPISYRVPQRVQVTRYSVSPVRFASSSPQPSRTQSQAALFPQTSALLPGIGTPLRSTTGTLFVCMNPPLQSREQYPILLVVRPLRAVIGGRSSNHA
jgi:hypothetical protein